MQEYVKQYWMKLNRYFTHEQSFLFGIYFCFVSFFLGDSIKDKNIKIEDLKCLTRIFKTCLNAEVKRSVAHLEESMDWMILNTNEQARMLVINLFWDLRYKIYDEYTFESVFREFVKYIKEANRELVTPECVNELITAFSCDRKCNLIMQAYSKLSDTGLNIYSQTSKMNKDNTYLVYEEMQQKYCDISKIRMYCHGITNPKVFISNPEYEKEYESGFDLVIADLPKGNNETICSSDIKSMTEEIAELPKKIFVEWAYLYHILENVNEEGRAIVVATKGALVREKERKLREYVIRKDWLDMVITLPEGLYNGSYLGFEILIFDKNKNPERKEKVMFADLSEKTYREGTDIRILEEVLASVRYAYHSFCRKEDYITIRTTEEICQQNFSWNPYVYTHIKDIPTEADDRVKLADVAQIMRGAQISKTDEAMLMECGTHYWLNIKNITNDKIIPDRNEKICAKTSTWEEKFGIREDDIIITSKGYDIKICIVPPDFPDSFLTGNLTRIRATKIHPYVLYEYLSSQEGRIAMERIQTGTTVRVLSNTNLSQLRIPLNKNQMEIGENLKNTYIKYWNETEKIQSEFDENRKNLLENLMGGT